MRVDKFLKNSRLIKRRTIASEMCDKGRVKINDKVSKSGTQVKPGDIIEITFGEKSTKVKVIQILEHVTKDDSDNMYELM